jgi:hypothetical protein
METQQSTLEQTEADLQQLAAELPPVPKIETNSAETPQLTEQQTASFNAQDTLQAGLVEAGVGGETAEAAAAVLAQEQADPINERTLEEQSILTEAYVQLQQDQEVAQIEERSFDLEAAATQYLSLAEAYESDVEAHGYPGQSAIGYEQAASRVYQVAIDQGVEADDFFDEVARQERTLQQDRVEQTAPIVVDLLNTFETSEYVGSNNTARYDEATQFLTVEENATGDVFLKAEWDDERWQDRGSSLTPNQVQMLQDLQPQIAAAQAQDNQQELGN